MMKTVGKYGNTENRIHCVKIDPLFMKHYTISTVLLILSYLINYTKDLTTFAVLMRHKQEKANWRLLLMMEPFRTMSKSWAVGGVWSTLRQNIPKTTQSISSSMVKIRDQLNFNLGFYLLSTFSGEPVPGCPFVCQIADTSKVSL